MDDIHEVLLKSYQQKTQQEVWLPVYYTSYDSQQSAYSQSQQLRTVTQPRVSMDTVSLPQLPATVLVTIAKLVDPADLVSLCDSHPQLAFLRLYLPELQDIPGESFRKH